MTYSESDILRAVGANAFSAGKAYQRQRRVIAFQWDGDDGIAAQVQGSDRRPYRLSIFIGANERSGSVIEGDCSCPVAFNCKHVAASLLHGLAMATKTASSTGVMPPMPPTASGMSAAARTAVAPDAPRPSQPAPSQLSPAVADWLDRLRQVDARNQGGNADLPQRLIYVLSPERGRTGMPRLRLEIRSGRTLKDGTMSPTSTSYNLQNWQNRSEAKFLRNADRKILAEMISIPRSAVLGHDFALTTERGAEILDQILATGRARWMTLDGIDLSAGAAVLGHVRWEPGQGGSLRAAMQFDDPSLTEACVCLNATPPVYIDTRAGVVGRIETALAPTVAYEMLDGPDIPAAQLPLVAAHLRASGERLATAAPPQLAQAEIVTGPFQPVLQLMTVQMPIPHRPGFYTYGQTEAVGIARLAFRYGTWEVAASRAEAIVLQMNGLTPVEVHRNARTEKAAMNQLRLAGFLPAPRVRGGVPAASQKDFLPDEGDTGWYDALYQEIPALERQGWRIEIAPDFPYQLLRSDGTFEARLGQGSGLDWFELDLGVMVAGQRLDLIGPLVRLLTKIEPQTLELLEDDEPLFIPLPDGQVLAVPVGSLLPLIRTLFDLFNLAGGVGANGQLRLSSLDAASLAELEEVAGAGVLWQGGDGVRALGRKLRDHHGIPDVALPAGFGATLRPYQAQGLAWLAFLKDAGLGGILADDMGLGKTVQALGLIAIEKAAGRLSGPVLVIAPTSLMTNWAMEAAKFVPDLSLLVLHGADRKQHFDSMDTVDLVLTTYPLLARDQAVLAGRDWSMIFLDEAQVIKNANAATTKLVHALKSPHRFCLTGTPLENHLGEVWSLFHFIAPGFLGDLKSFTRTWRTPIEKKGDTARARLLAGRIKPFLLRRTKEEVASDLPPKTVITEKVAFTSGQRAIYESIRMAMHAKVQAAIAEKGLARSHIVILDALLKLRQACCDPRLLNLARTKGSSSAQAGSAKLERLMELLAGLVDEGRKVIVFSQFTSMLDLIRRQLDDAGIAYALLTGDTVDRGTQVASFQEAKVPVFLISLKAGGVGLNLTAADTVILYDPWWNPAVEEQAIDRAHRIGQDKPVFVYRLVAVDTIEEKMDVLKEKKRALAASLFDHDGQPTLAMTEEDFDMLLT
ncbi:DEAD/DEAH box helicase [Rhizobium sp. 9140]|uniref:DEAD/DEAH box helicase n=1 Tax=Rhizobium sp. 9140 TaxID=1761900 RepID=UPI000791ED6C|nr:DEAD/DEAH box helicase [Rhizobium sp. 9140]CZT37218.1 SWIM zinc finger [Rhizobium sp. 9140]